MQKRSLVAGTLSLVLVITSWSHAAYVTGLTLSFESVKFFDHASNSAVLTDEDGNPAPLAAANPLFVDGQPYFVMNAALEMTPAVLVDDTTNGYAVGKFANNDGSATPNETILTLTGTILGVVNTPQVLFEAKLIGSESFGINWVIEEDKNFPGNLANGKAKFEVIGGLLADGSNPTGFELRDFSINFNFNGISPLMTDFENSHMDYTGDGTLQFNIVPEPVSLLLIGFGFLGLRKKGN